MTAGAALGIDVGFSPRSRTTAFCLMTWDRKAIRIRTRRTTSDPDERRDAVDDLLSRPLPPLTVAIDGPLTRGLGQVRHYRLAEALLSRGAFQKRGKPGQTSSPVGLRLHEHATVLAELVLERVERSGRPLAAATHHEPIHERAIVEAFPNLFLAALLPESELPRLRRDASDRYWEACLRLDRFDALMECLLPGVAFGAPLADYVHHDDRAAIVCALTAVAVARGEAFGVGDADDGDIMLPPPRSWGRSIGSDERWMARELRESLDAVQKRHARGASCRLTYCGKPAFL